MMPSKGGNSPSQFPPGKLHLFAAGSDYIQNFFYDTMLHQSIKAIKAQKKNGQA